MKRKLVVLIAAAFLIMGVSAVRAGSAKDESKVDTEVSAIDKDSRNPGNVKPIVQRIEKEFNVDRSVIDGLRSKKLGYGEIAIVLSLADKLPGRITDANVDTIMSKRQGPPKEGWGKIAKGLGLNLGTVLSRVEKVKDGAGNNSDTKNSGRGIPGKDADVKSESEKDTDVNPDTKKKNGTDTDARRHEVEKAERPSVPDRPERPELSNRPERSGR